MARLQLHRDDEVLREAGNLLVRVPALRLEGSAGLRQPGQLCFTLDHLSSFESPEAAARSVLQRLSAAETVQLAERLDEDGFDRFFGELTRRAAELRPDLFGPGPFDQDQAAGEVPDAG